MITNKNEAKTMKEHIVVQNAIQNKKRNNEISQYECKHYCKCKKDYSWNSSTLICENSKYLKSIADTSVIECDEIIIVIDNVLTKKTNTIATHVTRTASINSHSK